MNVSALTDCDRIDRARRLRAHNGRARIRHGGRSPAEHRRSRREPIAMSAPSPTPDLIKVLAEHARRAVDAAGVTTAAVSYWDREDDTMRTLVNVGALHASETAFPTDEAYPLDAFPAVAALLRFGRPYIDPPDVSSSAVLAALCHRSHAGVPIVLDGTVWGELWIASGERALAAQDLPALSAGAEAIGRMLAARTSR
jgi:hypothetical protein